MQSRRGILVSTALAFAAIDLVHKALTSAEFHHARTPYITLVMGGLIAALVVLVPRLPSTAAALLLSAVILHGMQQRARLHEPI